MLLSLGDWSNVLIRMGDWSNLLIRMGDWSNLLVRVGDWSDLLIRVGESAARHVGRMGADCPLLHRHVLVHAQRVHGNLIVEAPVGK